MKLHPVVFGSALLLAIGAGFGGGLFIQNRYTLLGGKPESEPKPAEPTPAQVWAEKKAVQKKVLIDYLDGKELKPPAGKPIPGAGEKPLVFRKAGIEAVQFSDTASRSSNEPWSTTITVVAAIDAKRYAIHARLEYREVEQSIVVVSFTPTEVSPQ